MNTITFQVSKTKEIEPEKFIYGIVIESEDLNKSINSIESILNNSNIEKVKLENHNFTLPENKDDLRSIQIFKLSARDELKSFTRQLNQIKGIRGGIIKTEIKDEENEEFELIKELTQKAKSKAEKYARLCGKQLLEITSFKVINSNQGGWTAFPPLRGINKQSIFNSIMMKSDKKDKYEINRTLEVQFEMKNLV